MLYQRAGDPLDVVYIDAEMTEADLQARLLDMGYGPDSDLSRLHYYLLPALPPLDTEAGGEALLGIAKGHGAAAVVIDTISRVISGPENDADTFLALYRNTGMRLKAEGIALLRLDHTGKDEKRGQRGSSAKAQDVDIAWSLTVAKVSVKGSVSVTLRLSDSRLSYVPPELRLTRLTEPVLSHVLPPGSGGTSAAATKVLKLLDEEAVPIDAGRVKASTILRDAGHTFANAALAEALKWRRIAPRIALDDPNGSSRGSPTEPLHDNEDENGSGNGSARRGDPSIVRPYQGRTEDAGPQNEYPDPY